MLRGEKAQLEELKAAGVRVGEIAGGKGDLDPTGQVVKERAQNTQDLVAAVSGLVERI